mmetsp:Transcript_10613/g.13888  ORF Transcript_10613/g.13888 Transcript_10613/m.13888 type:complete len:167 (-) Transcript_10613:355-855(-)
MTSVNSSSLHHSKSQRYDYHYLPKLIRSLLNGDIFSRKEPPVVSQSYLGKCLCGKEILSPSSNNHQILSCGHIFHEACLNRMIDFYGLEQCLPKCPCCRDVPCPYISTAVLNNIHEDTHRHQVHRDLVFRRRFLYSDRQLELKIHGIVLNCFMTQDMVVVIVIPRG